MEVAVLLPLKREVIYGPVNSRRLGRSLGINLSPSKYKLCSFNCVYCHYGWTRKLSADVSPYRDDMPTRAEVIAAVEEALKSPLEFEYITFSGNGEPTLHPQFPELVEDIVALRDRYRPSVKIGLLSNSTGLTNDRVRVVTPKIDFPMFKLDAGVEETFMAINRPAEGIRFATIVDHLASLSNILIQTVLIDGSPSNVTETELEAYFDRLRRIKPIEVHVYSIDRPVPETDISLVPPDKLRQIAERGTKETGITIKPFYPR
jgi:wyosine [tRNA(Phe)-imidazoG37] synthetase (radical SAM superfamily)